MAKSSPRHFRVLRETLSAYHAVVVWNRRYTPRLTFNQIRMLVIMYQLRVPLSRCEILQLLSSVGHGTDHTRLTKSLDFLEQEELVKKSKSITKIWKYSTGNMTQEVLNKIEELARSHRLDKQIVRRLKKIGKRNKKKLKGGA